MILERANRIIQCAEIPSVDSLASQVRIYVINLDRSPERWERLREQATLYGLSVARVPPSTAAAIRKATASISSRGNLSIITGAMLAGEYGCYRSHLRPAALRYQRAMQDSHHHGG